MSSAVLDLVIVGAGPAGLAAARDARDLGLDFVVLERRHVADTISQYPIGKPLFSTPQEIELVPGGLRCRAEKPTREELLTHYTRFAIDNLPEIRANEPVESIRRDGGPLFVRTPVGEYRTWHVLVATGVNHERKKLGVPGESPDRVSYRFVEAYPYAGRRVLVAGSGHSAAEAALFLEEVGAHVTLAMRRSGFGEDPARHKAAIKWWVREPIEALVAAGRLTLHFDASIAAIGEADATLAAKDGRRWTVPCDHLFALLGSIPDLSLLRGAGVEIAPDGIPVHDPETFETNVPGLYVAGHITREPHIKGALRVGPLVARRVASLRAGEQR